MFVILRSNLRTADPAGVAAFRSADRAVISSFVRCCFMLRPPVNAFPLHFHSRGSLRAILRFSEVSRAVVELREKPRKPLIQKLVAPTGFEPVFGRGHVFANDLNMFPFLGPRTMPRD